MAVETFEATYELVTPLFCGGAQQQAELRLPSFKGVLRWWWRALAWSHYGARLDFIHDAESRLFGSPAGGAGHGQSRVALRLEVLTCLPPLAPPKQLQVKPGDRIVGAGARYLGYGILEAFGSSNKGTRPGQLIRSCLEPPLRFKVELRCRDLSPDERQLLLAALQAIGLLGGLGAKSRKGFGSVKLVSLRGAEWTPPASAGELRAAIRRLLSEAARTPAAVPPYTALSSKARILTVAGADPGHLPLDVLDLVGREMIRYRSWGKAGQTAGSEPSEKNFGDDHQLIKKGPLNRHPRRIIFGLPHNYTSDHGSVNPEDFDRRASPLLIHLHAFEREPPIAVLSLLPADFLPPGQGIRVVVGNQSKRVRLAAEADLWKPVHELLDRYRAGRSLPQAFQGEEVSL